MGPTIVLLILVWTHSQTRFFQGVFNSTMPLSATWNFPDTIIRKALLNLIKREDRVSGISVSFFLAGGCLDHLINHPGEDKAALATAVRDVDRDAWATTNSLRLSAAFRHYSQACLRRREWVPEALGAQKHSRLNLL